MSVRLLRVCVVAVVGGEEGRADVRGNRDEVAHDLGLGGDAVVLQLDEEVAAAEDVLIHGGGVASGRVVPDLAQVAFLGGGVWGEQLGDVAAEASGGGDDPGGMRREQLDVHPRLVVEALEIRLRRQGHEVSVPGLVDGEEVHVVLDVFASRREGRSKREPGVTYASMPMIGLTPAVRAAFVKSTTP